MTQLDHAMGSIIGAFVGDAVGSTLEFATSITEAMAEEAMNFPGGGVHQIGKGQFTDDSELAMCQLQALKNITPGENFPYMKILSYYRKWYKSNPFDLGGTTNRAFGGPADESINDYLTRVAQVNAGSKANGSMMRMTPLSIWVRELDLEQKIEFLRSDSKLSHPNQTVQDACAAYGLAIAILVTTKGDKERALTEVERWIGSQANQEVQNWWKEAKMSDLSNFNATIAIGFVQWAFTLAFYFLRQEINFGDAIKLTLMEWGDTDTNAAIVGGLLGAYFGYNKIPADLKNPVLNYKYQQGDIIGYERPEFLRPSNLLHDVEILFKNSTG